MQTQSSNGQRFTLREVLDGLRDNFVAAFTGTNEALTSMLAVYDRAVSETILDLLDTPAPPEVTRKRRTRTAKALPAVERGTRRRRSKSGMPNIPADQTFEDIERESKQASIDDVVGQPA